MSKREVFRELMEGVAAMKSHRVGKPTLCGFKVQPAPLPKVDAKLIGTGERSCRPCETAPRKLAGTIICFEEKGNRE